MRERKFTTFSPREKGLRMAVQLIHSGKEIKTNSIHYFWADMQPIPENRDPNIEDGVSKETNYPKRLLAAKYRLETPREHKRPLCHRLHESR